MNTFRKHNDAWVVQVLSGATTGDTVAVTLRNGGSKQVTLGARVGDALYAVAARAPAAAAEAVGDLSRIIAMFDRAQQHLRHPAIVLDGFRVNIAGQRAREPGSLTITSSERTQAPRAFAGRPGMQREWLGRVTRAGMFEAGRNAPAGLGKSCGASRRTRLVKLLPTAGCTVCAASATRRCGTSARPLWATARSAPTISACRGARARRPRRRPRLQRTRRNIPLTPWREQPCERKSLSAKASSAFLKALGKEQDQCCTSLMAQT